MGLPINNRTDELGLPRIVQELDFSYPRFLGLEVKARFFDGSYRTVYGIERRIKDHLIELHDFPSHTKPLTDVEWWALEAYAEREWRPDL